mmetsp:Transcript_89626/g.123796  ORF Transcript_89626/g.123796 Transcript_89626/m.123796 type:complete len:116 (-) Transcript_89626:1320-1667(-)
MVAKLEKAEVQLVDHVGFTENIKTKNLLGVETVFYADSIQKSNNLGIVQTRTFVITSTGIYNIDKTSIKRKLEFEKVSSLSKTVHPSSNKKEFTVHVQDEYDYRFFCERREDLLK